MLIYIFVISPIPPSPKKSIQSETWITSGVSRRCYIIAGIANGFCMFSSVPKLNWPTSLLVLLVNEVVYQGLSSTKYVGVAVCVQYLDEVFKRMHTVALTYNASNGRLNTQQMTESRRATSCHFG